MRAILQSLFEAVFACDVRVLRNIGKGKPVIVLGNNASGFYDLGAEILLTNRRRGIGKRLARLAALLDEECRHTGRLHISLVADGSCVVARDDDGGILVKPLTLESIEIFKYHLKHTANGGKRLPILHAVSVFVNGKGIVTAVEMNKGKTLVRILAHRNTLLTEFGVGRRVVGHIAGQIAVVFDKLGKIARADLDKLLEKSGNIAVRRKRQHIGGETRYIADTVIVIRGHIVGNTEKDIGIAIRVIRLGIKMDVIAVFLEIGKERRPAVSLIKIGDSIHLEILLHARQHIGNRRIGA